MALESHCFNNQIYLTSKRESGEIGANKIKESHMEKYKELRDNYFEYFQENPTKKTSFSWWDNIFVDQRDFSLVKVGEKVRVLSSPYFPGKLAKVILDGCDENNGLFVLL